MELTLAIDEQQPHDVYYCTMTYAVRCMHTCWRTRHKNLRKKSDARMSLAVVA
jgi:hypothetical protein